jgi:hypothetical protein
MSVLHPMKISVERLASGYIERNIGRRLLG